MKFWRRWGKIPIAKGLLETPARRADVRRAVSAACATIRAIHLRKVFTEKYDEMVLVRDISFNSMCEHHLLPFMGKAHIGYCRTARSSG